VDHGALMKKLILLTGMTGAGLTAYVLSPDQAKLPARNVAAVQATAPQTPVPPAGKTSEVKSAVQAADGQAPGHRLEALRRLQDCYASQNCNFPQTDPRSYELALGQALRAELIHFRERYRAEPAARADLELAARTYIRSFDGFVQEAALNILSDLPPSQENLQALVAGLQGAADADLIGEALPELKRYMGSESEPLVHQFLSGTISTGAHFSSQKASENILPFVNEKSYPVYEETLRRLPPGTRAGENLSAALREYRRLQNGA
jgi:hypothetical protein